MNKTQLEIEQKKEYTAPQMEIVEMNHEGNILQDSCQGEYCGGPAN